MIIFLYGPDDYRRIKKKNEIVAEFEKKHSSLGLGSFDGEAAGAPESLFEFARSQSIFDDAKLAVVENAFEADVEKLVGALKPIAQEKNTTVLIAEREKPPKELAFLLKEPSLTQKFENLGGAEWAAFIRGEAKKMGFDLTADAVQFLGAVHRGDSWGLVTELQKLSALAAGAREGEAPAKAVGAKDLDALGLEAAPDYWTLVNGLKSVDGRIRLAALEKLFAINDPPPKIFNILAVQAGVKTPRMAEYDLAVKSGKLDYEEALVDLALA